MLMIVDPLEYSTKGLPLNSRAESNQLVRRSRQLLADMTSEFGQY